jgi:hypothetical protein
MSAITHTESDSIESDENKQTYTDLSDTVVRMGDVRVDFTTKVTVGDRWYNGRGDVLFAITEVSHGGRVRERLVRPRQLADMELIERN